jgi:hypothetical protein
MDLPRGAVEATAQGEVQIYAVGELRVPQLDNVRFGYKLLGLDNEHRQQVDVAGFVSNVGNLHGLGEILKTLLFKRDALPSSDSFVKAISTSPKARNTTEP